MKSMALVLVVVLFGFSIVSAKVGGGDILFRVKGAGNVQFSHDRHLESGLQCTDCHDHLFLTKAKHRPITMAEMRQGKSCGACHNGQKAFSVKDRCNTCHQEKGGN